MSDQRPNRMRALVVELVETAPPAPPYPLPESVARPPRRSAVRVVVAAAIVVALLAVALGAIALFGSGDHKPPAPAHQPKTKVGIAYVGNDGLYVDAHRVVAGTDITRPRFSYDGRYLAFERGDRLLVVRRDGSTPVNVAGRIGRWAWAPDRDAIAVLSGGAGETSILVFGIGDPHHFVTGPRARDFVDDFAWAPDGRIVLSHRGGLHDGLGWVDPNAPDGIVHPYALDLPGNDYGLFVDGVAPDGSPVVTVDGVIGSTSLLMDRADLAVVRNGKATIVGGMFLQRSWAQWSPDGSLVFVDTSGRMVTDTRTVTLCSPALRCHALSGPGTQTLEPSFSPDGRRLVFVRNDASNDPTRYVRGGGADWRLHYAGRRLWIANADGTNARPLDTKATGIGVPTWASNRTVVFTLDDGTLVSLDVRNGTEHVVGQLATRGTLPPTQVYDPTDANGERQWTDLFAVAS